MESECESFLDYPEEPEFGYETEELIETMEIEMEFVDDFSHNVRESIIITVSQRLEDYILNEETVKVETVLKQNGLNFIDEFKQSYLLQLACLYSSSSIVELLCRYKLDGTYVVNFLPEITDFEQVFENLRVIVDMNYFEQYGNYLVNALWFSDDMPMQGRRHLLNYLLQQDLLNYIEPNSQLRESIKDQFNRQFLPSLNQIVPFGVSHLIADYLMI